MGYMLDLHDWGLFKLGIRCYRSAPACCRPFRSSLCPRAGRSRPRLMGALCSLDAPTHALSPNPSRGLCAMDDPHGFVSTSAGLWDLRGSCLCCHCAPLVAKVLSPHDTLSTWPLIIPKLGARLTRPSGSISLGTLLVSPPVAPSLSPQISRRWPRETSLPFWILLCIHVGFAPPLRAFGFCL